MNNLRLLGPSALLIIFCLLANYSFGQEKQAVKKEESPRKMIIIQKSNDGDDKARAGKIIRRDHSIQELQLDGQEEHLILKEIGAATPGEIRVVVKPEMGRIDMEQNVDVEIEVVDGEKHLKVTLNPIEGEGKTFEWKGEGDIPVEIKEDLELDGIFIEELDGADVREKGTFFFRNDQDGEFQWNSEEGEKVFFLKTDEEEGTRVHTRHRIVVITRGDKTEDKTTEARELPTETLPESALERDLQLRDFNLFPNPSEGDLRLRFQAEAEPTVIKITDLNGKQMYRERLNRFDGQYDQNLDLSDLPAGLFLLTIEQKEKIYTEQIVIK